MTNKNQKSDGSVTIFSEPAACKRFNTDDVFRILDAAELPDVFS